MRALITILIALIMSPCLHAELSDTDTGKLDKLVDQYRNTPQKAPIIKQINNLKAQYANDKNALVVIEKKFSAVQTGLVASYEKSLQEQEEREYNALLQQWSAANDVTKKDLEKEIARVAKNLRSRNRFLAALELEEGLKSLQTGKKFVNPEEAYRKDLSEIMNNLDYGLYQDGDDNTPQKLFYQLQQLVQAANNYLLLNTIPNSWATYSGLRSTIQDLIVRIQMNDPTKIRYIFEQKLTTQANGIDDGIQDTIARCNRLQKEEILLIDPRNFDTARTILAQAPKFAHLAKYVFETWNKSKEQSAIKLSSLNLDQSKKNSWFGDLAREQGYIRQLKISTIPNTFLQHYKKINSEYAAQAFILGHNLPETPYALLWRLIPPNDKDLEGKEIFPPSFIDGLKKKIEKFGNKSLREASTELQTIIATTSELKKALEAQNVAAYDINLTLYPWRLEISKRLADLQWAILIFHDYYEQHLKIVTPELFIASLLTDNEIYALSKNNTPLSTKMLTDALEETKPAQDSTIFDNAAEAHKELLSIQQSIAWDAFNMAFPDREIGDELPPLNSQSDKVKVTNFIHEILDQELPQKLGILDLILDLKSGLDFFAGYLKMLKDQTITHARKKALYHFTSEDTETSLRKQIKEAEETQESKVKALRQLQSGKKEAALKDLWTAQKDVTSAEEKVLALNQKLALFMWNKLNTSQKKLVLQARKEADINLMKGMALGASLGTLIATVNTAGAIDYYEKRAYIAEKYPISLLLGWIEVKPRFIPMNVLSLVTPQATDQSSYQSPLNYQQILDYLPSSEAKVPINAFTIGYYFCGSFTDQTPEFVIFLEVSTIINNLQLVEYLIKQPATKDLKPNIRRLFFDFAHNRAWQHLTIINKAIKNIRARNTKEDSALADKLATKIASFRSKLTEYFDHKQQGPAPAAS